VRERFGQGVAINRFIEQPTVQRLGALLDGVEAVQQDPLARPEQDARANWACGCCRWNDWAMCTR
jgi:hypothetical protein